MAQAVQIRLVYSNLKTKIENSNQTLVRSSASSNKSVPSPAAQQLAEKIDQLRIERPSVVNDIERVVNSYLSRRPG